MLSQAPSLLQLVAGLPIDFSGTNSTFLRQYGTAVNFIKGVVAALRSSVGVIVNQRMLK
jgi:hypothetical protein